MKALADLHHLTLLFIHWHSLKQSMLVITFHLLLILSSKIIRLKLILFLLNHYFQYYFY